MNLPGYDMWLQRGLESAYGGDYLEGYPVRCPECGDRVYPPEAEALVGEPHCVDEDTDEIYSRYECESDYDFSWDDPRIP